MSKKFKLRLIGQHDIASQKDVDEWKAMVADQEEQTSAFDLLHSFTTHPTSKQLKVRTYLKVEREEESGGDKSTRCG
jgi:hypothetical protein